MQWRMECCKEDLRLSGNEALGTMAVCFLRVRYYLTYQHEIINWIFNVFLKCQLSFCLHFCVLFTLFLPTIRLAHRGS